MIIKTLKDAKQFIDDFKKYSYKDYYDGRFKFSFKDFRFYNGGTTQLVLDEDNEFYDYSYGKNWCDRTENEIDDPVRYVWKNRKSINAQLKRKE